MSVRVRDVIRWMHAWAPPGLAMSGDRIGLQTGDSEAALTTVLTTLDITEAVVDEAIREQAQMIVSHHALLYRPLSGLQDQDPVARAVLKVVRHGIAVFAAHTNLDRAVGGINDVLLTRLGVQRIGSFGDTRPDQGQPGLGRFGSLRSSIPLRDFANEVRHRLGIPYVRVTGDPQKSLGTVGVVGGAGDSFLREAAEVGVECLVTGDMKHHSALDALAMGLCVIDAGHFGTEKHAAQLMKERLEGEAEREGIKVRIVPSATSTDPLWLSDVDSTR